MKKYLLFPLLFLIFACSSEEMKGEVQGYDPLVGSWDDIMRQLKLSKKAFKRAIGVL
tara:strand:- start:403 stop:573 length:171 start_codon:yes stop_codon:yes gene_type:complete